MQVKKQQLERHRTMDWFQIGKGVHQGCILSPCLFNLYVSYEKPGWMKHNLESRFLGEISITSYADDTTLTAESEEELKSLLIKVKEESEKAGLNSTFRKLRSWHLVSLLHGK